MDEVITRIEQITKKNVLNNEVNEWLFGFDDDNEPIMPDVERIINISKIRQKAKDWGMKSEVSAHLKNLEKQFNHDRSEAKKEKIRSTGGNTQDFDSNTPYELLNIGCWFCDMSGIKYINDKGIIQNASYTPITLFAICKNKETGDEKACIAFYKNGKWEEISPDKSDISSASKIVKIANSGINVTSENAKMIVRYLSDLEGMNKIPVIHSTSKLGWHKVNGDMKFLPYDDGILFDADDRFKRLSDSIETTGTFEGWKKSVIEMRKFKRIEPRIMLAASFASILVTLTDSLPFLVHLFGETGGGKTVCLMLASSVWANPSIGSGFMGDWLTTLVAVEARANTLNNLPMVMDDTAKAQKRLQDDFSEFIYILANGTGKERSNQNIGLRCTNSWSNCTLTTGEHPIIGENEQGGAVNRVVEIKADIGEMFSDPRWIVEQIKENHGHAGKEFVKIVKEQLETLQERFSAIYNSALSFGGTKKQAMAVACICLADFICTSYNIYGCKDIDGVDNESLVPLNFQKFMKSDDDVSENQRCYDFIIDQVSINSSKFEDGQFGERWGVITSDEVIFIKSALSKLCKLNGYDCDSFVRWLDYNDKLRKNGKKDTIQPRDSVLKGRPRCYAIKLPAVEVDNN